MGFPRQEYWSGLPFSSPGDLPNSGIKPTSPALWVDFLPFCHQGGPRTQKRSSKESVFRPPRRGHCPDAGHICEGAYGAGSPCANRSWVLGSGPNAEVMLQEVQKPGRCRNHWLWFPPQSPSTAPYWQHLTKGHQRYFEMWFAETQQSCLENPRDRGA